MLEAATAGSQYRLNLFTSSEKYRQTLSSNDIQRMPHFDKFNKKWFQDRLCWGVAFTPTLSNNKEQSLRRSTGK